MTRPPKVRMDRAIEMHGAASIDFQNVVCDYIIDKVEFDVVPWRDDGPVAAEITVVQDLKDRTVVNVWLRPAGAVKWTILSVKEPSFMSDMKEVVVMLRALASSPR